MADSTIPTKPSDSVFIGFPPAFRAVTNLRMEIIPKMTATAHATNVNTSETIIMVLSRLIFSTMLSISG